MFAFFLYKNEAMSFNLILLIWTRAVYIEYKLFNPRSLVMCFIPVLLNGPIDLNLTFASFKGAISPISRQNRHFYFTTSTEYNLFLD